MMSTSGNFQAKPKKIPSQTKKICCSKAELLQEGIFFFIHLFAGDVLIMKKLEIKKTIISVLKVET